MEELEERIQVPFSAISSSFQRTVKLRARTQDKQIDFIISGESILFERNVLIRVRATFDLMLNHLVRDIETKQIRQQLGKTSIGKIAIDISKKENEYIIILSSDGAGLCRCSDKSHPYYQVFEQLSGHLQSLSKTGEGSTFEIHLPC